MNSKEVLSLLIYCNELDGRHSPNEAKVVAWTDVLSICPDMPLSFAKEVAKRHYGKFEEMLAPSQILKAWQHRQEALRAAVESRQTERACGRSGCLCTHTAPCYKGWIDDPSGDTTAPCPNCRAELRQILSEIPGPGMRSAAHIARIGVREIK